MKRLFVAVPVSDDITEKIRPVIEKLKETGADLKFVSHFHFTLKFLGDVNEKNIQEIEEKLAEIAKKTKAFPICVKSTGVFPSLEKINVVWIGVQDSQFSELMKKITTKLDYIRKDVHEEVPHLTIARMKSGRNKEQLKEALQQVEHREFGSMIVEKIILYESELTPEGPVYTIVGEFLLQ